MRYAALVAHGRHAARSNDVASAISDFRAALAISPDDGGIHLALARALSAAREQREAATEYEAARRIGFGEPAPTDLSIAAAYLAAGDAEQARHWIDRALEDRLKDRGSLATDSRFSRLGSDPLFRSRLGTIAGAASDRISAWKSDLDFLAMEIQRLHPLYRERLPEEYSARVVRLKNSLPHLTDQEIVLDTMAALASLRSAHTVVFPFGMTRGTLFRLPLQLYRFTDGLFIVAAPAELGSLIGAKVTEIGGRSVDDLLAAAAPFVSRDNDAFLDFATPFALTLPDLLRRLGATVAVREVEMKVEMHGSLSNVEVPIPQTPIDPDKIPLKLMPPPAGKQPPPDWLSHPYTNFWMKRLAAATLYVQINQCVDSADETLAAFAVRLARELRSARTSNLIVDVRRNNGGNEDLMRPVVASMLTFQRDEPGARIFVVIGRNTLSAAQNFISTLDQWLDVTFVGEPSGSKPNHAGDDTLFVLPYSGLMGSIACALHQTEFRDLREWIAPDLPIGLSSRDYFGQHDPALAVILRSAAKRSPEASPP